MHGDLSTHLFGLHWQLNGGDPHRLFAVGVIVIKRLPGAGRLRGFDIRFTGDVFAVWPHHHVVELSGFARAQHLNRHLGQIDIDAAAQDAHLPPNIERRFQ